VKEIVELHGGRVRLQAMVSARSNLRNRIASSPSGGFIAGRRFVSSPERAADSACIRGMRVLVVDDEPDALAMMRRILEEYEEFVGSAEAALAMLSDDTFDCIISDVGVPFCDGYALIAEVRRRGIQVPAIAMTAVTRQEDQVQTRNVGYQAHVCKPMETGQLLSAITSLTTRVTR